VTGTGNIQFLGNANVKSLNRVTARSSAYNFMLAISRTSAFTLTIEKKN
jgi:hypothetical protein